MIEVDSLLYKIDQKLNKLSTLSHQSIQLEDKILALNEAQIALIKQKVGGFSAPSNGLGLASFKKRYSDLQNLVLSYIEGELKLQEIDNLINQWGTPFGDLKKPLMFYIDSYIIASKGRCKNHVIWVNQDLTKYNDVSMLLSNEHTAPSFEWQCTFCTISEDSINIFTDGSFKPSKIYVSYLRYPVYIDKEGYQKFDGSLSNNQNCELIEYLEDELIDLAVQRLGMYTQNPNAVQNSQYRIQTNE